MDHSQLPDQEIRPGTACLNYLMSWDYLRLKLSGRVKYFVTWTNINVNKSIVEDLTQASCDCFYLSPIHVTCVLFLQR